MPGFPPLCGYFLLRAKHPQHHHRGILIGSDRAAGIPAVYKPSLTPRLLGPVADVQTKATLQREVSDKRHKEAKGPFRKTLLERRFFSFRNQCKHHLCGFAEFQRVLLKVSFHHCLSDRWM
ncbi:hypothetical protein RRG08_038067 [Elysia crispata]|uniref:Uncharacterized protein n=1 Tax=Elysia crispata TaxID=231223 RepID=A0AAE0ZY25_9GAST|nr:hypothetical protein RRG08_038067 [Elysia crispata]